jgi:hypothetical protein
MSRILRKVRARRPSAGLIVGSLALILAVGGTAVALPGKKRVDRNDLKKGVVKTGNIRGKAVTTQKLRGQAVTTNKLRNLAVTTAKLKDDSVTERKLAPAATPLLVAFGHVNDPAGADDPTLQDSYGLTGVAEHLAGNDGATRVTVDPKLIPAGTLARCTVQTTLTDAPNAGAALGAPGFINVATGTPLAANEIQVQTRDETAAVADRSYQIGISCPPA